MINNEYNLKDKTNDFKRSFLINNEKDNEHYIREFKDSSEARHWIINHLDLSKGWTII